MCVIVMGLVFVPGMVVVVITEFRFAMLVIVIA